MYNINGVLSLKKKDEFITDNSENEQHFIVIEIFDISDINDDIKSIKTAQLVIQNYFRVIE